MSRVQVRSDPLRVPCPYLTDYLRPFAINCRVVIIRHYSPQSRNRNMPYDYLIGRGFDRLGVAYNVIQNRPERSGFIRVYARACDVWAATSQYGNGSHAYLFV